MAHIKSVVVQGLAGRSETVECELDRHLNVFFGLNGSGKTTLLNILQSALGGDHSLLARAAFSRAEVVLYSDDFEQEFTLTLEAHEGGAPRLQRTLTLGNDEPYYLDEEGELVLGTPPGGWTYEPELPRGATGRFAHRYLPTWRMYEPNRVRPGAPVRTRGVDWDKAFADTLERLWSQYSSTLLTQVRAIQAEGLANVLDSMLGRSSKGSTRVDVPEAEAAELHERVSAFLRRQGSRAPRLKAFLERYSNDPQFRSVVDDIDAVERRIEEVLQPRSQLEQLVTQLFSGSKTVRFEDRSLTVAAGDERELSLASLSAGEKQVLRILFEVLFVNTGPFLIDEPEISLHIDWQRELLAALRQLNEGAQLVVATHSPEVMAEVPDSRIFRL